MSFSASIEKIPRHYLSENFVITDWSGLEPFLKELLEREINSEKEMEKWLKDMSELESVISEEGCWRHIRVTCDTTNKELEDSFAFFMMEIQPKIQPYADELNRKLIANPLTKKLDPAKYFTYLRSIRKSIELFREKNIPLQAELNVMGQQYGAVTGKMTVQIRGQEFTIPQASKFLENSDRALREEAFIKIQERRFQDRDTLNELFTNLVSKRHQVAINAGFENYRDYKFVELGRFDYTKEDCFRFHDSIKQHVMPLVKRIYENKKIKLSLTQLRPWDTDAEPAGIEPLHPFTDGAELTSKTINCLKELNPFFADCILAMKKMGRLDLESRKGKAPGGYNCPLAETGAPFIFMNASGQMSDVTTMVHEGGHAVQSFLAHGLELNAFKDYPMEIAEVASMAMELFTMDHWDAFFDDKESLRRAKEYQLERVITIFPWIATIDKFQHWVYEHPDHSVDERNKMWIEITQEFSTHVVDWSGLETFRSNNWQKQLHLFEVPFYYIEYGIAQLGAIGLWMQFKNNPAQALENYMKALSLGGTKTLPELYQAAGLEFNFSGDYIRGLMQFLGSELEKLITMN